MLTDLQLLALGVVIDGIGITGDPVPTGTGVFVIPDGVGIHELDLIPP